jgi:uncharacterized protein YktB (UPF0637 family)
MLIIKALDDDAHLEYSEYTRQWFVSADIDIKSDGCLIGVVEHADTTDEAVGAFLARITHIKQDELIVTRALKDDRRHWRWNGAAFAEQRWTYNPDHD